jgi:hypothetical protein
MSGNEGRLDEALLSFAFEEGVTEEHDPVAIPEGTGRGSGRCGTARDEAAGEDGRHDDRGGGDLEDGGLGGATHAQLFPEA